MVPRTGSVLTDNVVADIASVGMTGMDAGLINPVDSRFGTTTAGCDVDDCELDDNVDGVDTELLDDDGLSTVPIRYAEC